MIHDKLDPTATHTFDFSSSSSGPSIFPEVIICSRMSLPYLTNLFSAFRKPVKGGKISIRWMRLPKGMRSLHRTIRQSNCDISRGIWDRRSEDDISHDKNTWDMSSTSWFAFPEAVIFMSVP